MLPQRPMFFRKHTSLAALLILGGYLALPAPLASACSGPICPTLEIYPPSGELPALLEAFRVQGGTADGLTVSLFRTDLAEMSNQAVDIVQRGAETWLAPTQPLVAGAHYVLEVTQPCGHGEMAVTARGEYDVLEPAPWPESLGNVQIVGEGKGEVPVEHGASCYESIAVNYADVRPSLSVEHEGLRTRFADYRVSVDGKVFSWSLSANGGFFSDNGESEPSNEAWFKEPDVFRLWTYCAETGDTEQPSSSGLTPGRHSVVIEARLPAVDGRWIRSHDTEVTLACPQADAGATANDGGPRPPTSDADDGRGDDSNENKRSTGSRGCNLAETPRGSWPMTWVITGSLLLLLRARRPRSACAPS